MSTETDFSALCYEFTDALAEVLAENAVGLARRERRERAFSIFYTGAIGAGATAPILYGGPLTEAEDAEDAQLTARVAAFALGRHLRHTWRVSVEADGLALSNQDARKTG
jgi:hypothetical protein